MSDRACGASTVLHVVNSLDVGGTEKQLYLLLKHIDRARFDSKVLALSSGGHWTGPIRELGIELIELERRGSFEMRRLLELKAAMRRCRPEIVHTWHPGGNFYGGLAASLGGCRRRVLSYRSLDRQHGLRAVVEAVTFRLAAAVVCNSQGLAHDLTSRGLLKESATAVVYNGMEASPRRSTGESEVLRRRIRAELALPADAFVIATIGRMVPFKNHAFLIEIAGEVLQRCPTSLFVFIGDGPERPRLEVLAKRHGVAGHVRFLGQRANAAGLLPGCDVFVFPSRQIKGTDGVAGEGFPNAVMEAMDAGLPCVASTTSGAGELFRDGEAGFLVSPDDKAGFVHALARLLRDPALCATIGRHGRGIIAENFSAEIMARNMAAVYMTVIDNSASISGMVHVDGAVRARSRRAPTLERLQYQSRRNDG